MKDIKYYLLTGTQGEKRYIDQSIIENKKHKFRVVYLRTGFKWKPVATSWIGTYGREEYLNELRSLHYDIRELTEKKYLWNYYKFV